MSRKGNPYDNAQAESFFKTLKSKEVYLTEYRSMKEVKERLGEFIDQVYHQERLHSALDYVSPVEFEIINKRSQKGCIPRQWRGINLAGNLSSLKGAVQTPYTWYLKECSKRYAVNVLISAKKLPGLRIHYQYFWCQIMYCPASL